MAWSAGVFPPTELPAADSAEPVPGKAVYRYYCYQCHGYSGDANTLASSYLNPRPRDFTAHTDESLAIERMVDAVKNGRAGTAMVSFASVLDDAEITDVVEYVRTSFMSGTPLHEDYHSIENGWIDHERYASAFPFIQGTLAIDTPGEQLDANQRAGKQLYLSACISCHDRANTGGEQAIWELRAVSYPREHYSHRTEPLDLVSGASPYAVHDVPAEPANMTERELRGMQLYQDNCAFCHAADGTGQNWIGSFLQPRPRNFTAETFVLWQNPDGLRNIVRDGIENSSMPAWRDVLTHGQIDEIIAYMHAAFAAGETLQPGRH